LAAFPIQVGIFSLSDFGHAKVEASALDDIKLADIEFKRHDPHRVVENHLAQFNMKRYIHENSPYDEVFRGVRSYDEVISRFQSLLEEEQSGFLSFQKHRRISLPKILQVEQSLSPTSQVPPSSNPKQHDFPEVKTKEVEKTPEIFPKDTTITGISIPGKNNQESLALFEAFMKHGHSFPQLLTNTKTPVKYITNQGESTALSIPIPSLTPLATSSDLPCSEVINIDDLTPIEPEEMPSSYFFFNKKRKAIIRRESQQKGGVITKKQRMVYDGHGQSDPEFAKQVADSLGEFATTNLWSVDQLRKKLDQKNILIEQLHNDMKQIEFIAREKINSEINQVKQGFEQQINQLEEKLKISFQNQHLSKNMVSQRDIFINQLQARIVTIESTVIDISSFKKQALEINEGLQIVQQNFYESLDTIQKYYQVINGSLQSIDDKEKESIMAKSKFQELIGWRQNLNIPGFVPFSEIEQIKGEIALKS
jgi:hypothetical protein